MDRQATFHVIDESQHLVSNDDVDRHINEGSVKYAVGDIINIPGYRDCLEANMCMVIYKQNPVTKKKEMSAMFGTSDDTIINIPLCNIPIRKMLIGEGVKFNDILSVATMPQNMYPDTLYVLALDDPDVKANVIEMYTELGLY